MSSFKASQTYLEFCLISFSRLETSIPMMVLKGSSWCYAFAAVEWILTLRTHSVINTKDGIKGFKLVLCCCSCGLDINIVELVLFSSYVLNQIVEFAFFSFL